MPNPRDVENLFRACQFYEGESVRRRIKVRGVSQYFWFNPDRLKKSEAKIKKMLSELHGSLKKSTGGGLFLEMVRNSLGAPWTSSHEIIEYLLVLGVGVEMIEYSQSLEDWKESPNTNPLIMITDEL